MHELSICRSLIGQLDLISSQYPERKIAAIYMQVGPLSGVVPELLLDAFPLASIGTIAEDAELNCLESHVRVHCPDCGKDSNAAINNLTCPLCDNWLTQLISGDELILQRVELDAVGLKRDTTYYSPVD